MLRKTVVDIILNALELRYVQFSLLSISFVCICVFITV